ncbi:MAG: hypothetical protein C4551_05260 [Bacillota bacterium]|nr:MAG: hypothetical protein C4551_05260 [Bacillota bacterium]
MEFEERRVRVRVLAVVLILTVGSAAAFLARLGPGFVTTGFEPGDAASDAAEGDPRSGDPRSGAPEPGSGVDVPGPEAREDSALVTKGQPLTPGDSVPFLARADLGAGVIRVELLGGSPGAEALGNPASPERFSLAGWHLYIASARREFTFPEGTVLEAGTAAQDQAASAGEAAGGIRILMIETNALEVCRSYAAASPYVARVFLWPDLALASRHLETVQLYDPDWNLVSSLACPE